MNFNDCVFELKFFHVLTCDDHGYPPQLSFWSNSRSFVVSMARTDCIYGRSKPLSFFPFVLRSIDHVRFRPIFAYSKFGHVNISQIYSVMGCFFDLISSCTSQLRTAAFISMEVHAFHSGRMQSLVITDFACAAPLQSLTRFRDFNFFLFASATWFFWVSVPNILVS